MPLYISREAPKLWRKFWTEVSIEISLLSKNWKHLLAGIVFQYIHGLAARGVHYIHRPGPILQDVGFFVIPELGQEKSHISETLFSFIFGSFFLWTFHPFFFHSKRIYTVLIWCRVLAYLVGSPLATLSPPESLFESLVIIPRGILYGCGDLIFSSHMTFTLVFVRTYHKYGTLRIIKQISWILSVAQSLLIIASRKHYTVDIVVAWYTVSLLMFFIDKKLPELPDRSSASGLPSLFPTNGKIREERFILMNDITTNTV